PSTTAPPRSKRSTVCAGAASSGTTMQRAASRRTGSIRVTLRGCEVRIGLLLEERDWEAQILLRQVRWSAGGTRARLLQRGERPRRVGRLPSPKVAQAPALEPQLDTALTLQRCPSLRDCGRGPRRET